MQPMQHVVERLRIGKSSFLLIPQTDGVLMMDLSHG